ncbi:LysR family transcriptional regulator [Achromobacter aloeverae]|uniref:LysR family transcriptional regulator n=1 Tax=Achromobacter aloeverae TaxID=1750518 RepID=A0A4V1MS35_9BURK|nr:LysR family transcriptional regulator [Achromobacter aloeverae]RXN88100.1 LysR family transcriptional regulator [Achromobacter aloeverae]
MDENWLLSLRRTKLNQLVSFSAVAAEGSFRRAAARLHISQSALSVQVQQLELALGVHLLHRDTRSVRLTSEGERLHEAFKHSGQGLARVLSNLREEGRLQQGTVSVAVLPSLASTFLPRVMLRFQDAFPGIKVRMKDADSQRAHEQILRGGVDIAIASRGSPDVTFHKLFEEKLMAVVAASDPYFAKRRSVTLAHLARRPLLLNPRGVDHRERVEEMFQAAGLAIVAAQELTSTAPLVAMTAIGLGVCIQPLSSLQGLDLAHCRLLPLKPAATREVGAIVPPDRTLSPATAAFLAFLLSNSGAA